MSASRILSRWDLRKTAAQRFAVEVLPALADDFLPLAGFAAAAGASSSSTSGRTSHLARAAGEREAQSRMQRRTTSGPASAAGVVSPAESVGEASMTAVMESPTASASSRITAAADSARYALEEASAETSSATDVPKA